jgi:hypothetical protein
MSKKKKNSQTDTIDLPEVKDIPGQEHIKPPRINEMADTTASSADEEGEGLLDEINNDDLDDLSGKDNVSDDERALLDQTDRPVTEETEDLDKLALDEPSDEELNETSNPLDLGKDLDIPGSELDDDNEELGEEDEENNSYSGKD